MKSTAELLEEARTALHQLNIGRGVVSVWYEGRRTEFSPANRSQLEKYISQLEAQVADKPHRRGPAGVNF